MLVILVCFIGRKENEKRFFDSAEKSLTDYRISWLDDSCELPTVERYNLLYNNERFDDNDYIMFGADDITFEKDFDKKAEQIFKDNPDKDIVYPNDGIQKDRMATHPIFRKSFLDKAGELFPSGYMRHSYVDNYILDLGNKLGNIMYCPDLIIDHHHPIAGRGRWDKHYLKVYDRQYMLEDQRLYQLCIKEHLPKIIARFKI